MAQPTGQCAMQGSCGRKGWLGQPLPCPYDGPPAKVFELILPFPSHLNLHVA